MEEIPSCPHGPCLIFERQTLKKKGEKFYACSACRDRSVCNFFHWVGDKFTSQQKELWNKIIKNSKSLFSTEDCMKRLAAVQEFPHQNQKYCQTCSVLIFQDEKKHSNHDIGENVTSDQLLQPTKLFHTLTYRKSEAQYFFAPKTVQFVVSTLKTLNISKLVLIGTPKIHEYLQANPEKNEIKSFLLDIDDRFRQFFSPQQYCRYNMFNNHFFGDSEAEEEFKKFLKEEEGETTAVLLDPPFGGMVSAISASLQKVIKCRESANNRDGSDLPPVLWFFPYFLEPQVIEHNPTLVMSDYHVEYSDHRKFGAKRSPARIFTNIPFNQFVLPESEGYKFCEPCGRWISKDNQHCDKCNSCTTKHGNTYKHCDACQRCVKSNYAHCESHNRCSPAWAMVSGTNKCGCNVSADESGPERCFKCLGFGHRKRECPTNRPAKKKRVKQEVQKRQDKGQKRPFQQKSDKRNPKKKRKLMK